MRTANPALKANTFAEVQPVEDAAAAMTIQGTVTKTAVLAILALLAAAWTWRLFFEAGNPAAVVPWAIGGALGGFVVSLVTIFAKTWAPFTAPVYAVLEGLVLGAISAMLEARFPGIAIQAVGLTFGTLLVLLGAYKSGLIRATENFKLGVVAATGAIALVYLASFVLRLFGVHMPFIHDAGPIGIGVSVVIVIIAALNLVLDFDFIEQGAASRAPKYMEWYAAFGLMVTLVWLYLEILRLLAKVRGRK